MYWCRTLGELALYADSSQAVPLVRAGKSLAILAYLGLSPRRSECRDRIAQLFWPDASLSQAHHTLRQLLYRIRQAVPDERLLNLDGNSLVLSAEVEFDALAGEQALEAGDVESAFNLLRGTFLEGFSIAESAELEEWVESQRARFRECFARAGEALIEREIAEGRPEQAVTVAEEVKAANPLDESRARLLIETLDSIGQARRALAEYESYATLLRTALEDEPSPELQAYARELESSVGPGNGNVATVLPFVGRSQAWATLLQGLAAAESGRCSLVLIEGDAGLGKTRLVEEFAARARARGAVWLSGKCFEMEQTLPYAVISDACQSLRVNSEKPANESDPEVTAVSPHPFQISAEEAGDRNQRERDGNGELRLRNRMVEWLDELTEAQPVFLSCDDIHWADPASLRLLHVLTHQLATSPLLIVCSYRPAELTTVARRFASSLISEGLAELITLKPLTVEHVEEILRGLGQFRSDDASELIAGDLHRHTGGNPLFVVELLETLEGRGDLKIEAGYWSVSGSLGQEDLPKTLRKILTDRVDRLANDQRLALEVSAVIGEDSEAGLLAAVLDISEPAAELLQTELAKTRLLRRLPFGRCALAHDELRQLVYAAIPDDRRREIHSRVAASLLSRGEAARPGGTARLARHFEQAGDPIQAREYALTAAREAAAVGASESQASFLQLAEACASGGEEGDRTARRVTPVDRRRWAWYAGAALSVGIVATGLLLIGGGPGTTPGARAPIHPWEQGVLYLREWESTPPGNPRETFYRVKWPETIDSEAEIVPVDGRPAELPPPLFTRIVDIGATRHGKIFQVAGHDTVQLTWGPTDDGQAKWSPDRRLVGVQRGWREGQEYRFNLFVIDTAGRDVWRVTDGPYQDGFLDWSPDGSRIAFRRNDGGQYSIWLSDADGRRKEKLVDLGDSGPRTPYASFSLDGRSLAWAMDEASDELEVIDLRRRLAKRIPVGCSLVPSSFLWSPDGEWLATLCRTAEDRTVIMVSMTGRGGPYSVAAVPSPRFHLSHWIGDRPGHVANIRTGTGTIELAIGEGRSMSLEATDSTGRTVFPAMRWQIADTLIAKVDGHGFVRGSAPGTTKLVASAGGFRADTVVVHVQSQAIDTLLYELWDEGIDTATWKIVGWPEPATVAGAGPDGSAALLSNGDYNWPSGVITREEFDLSRGLTVEFQAYLELTGLHWQELAAHVVPLAKAFTPGNERALGSILASFRVIGQSPTVAKSSYSCSEGMGTGSRAQAWPPPGGDSGWHRFVIQIRPDGYFECYLNGERLGPYEISEPLRAPRAAVFLGGRSNLTKIYHGPLLVTRGLRY